MTGLGSAKLNRGGTEYIGFVTVESNVVYFDVTVDADKVQGKLLKDNKFIYRNEEETGKYVYFDYLDHTGQGVYTYYALALDGYGVGDVGSVVLRDRKHLAEDGIMVVVMSLDRAGGELVAGPDIVSRRIRVCKRIR